MPDSEDGGTTTTTTVGQVTEETQEPKTLTQEQVDRIVEERLARERKKFEGFEELKAKAEQFEKLEQEKKTELERAQEALARYEEEKKSLSEKLRRTNINGAIKDEAMNRGFLDPSDAVKLVDESLLEVDDEGRLDAKSLKNALEKLAEQKPHLVGSRKGSADGGPRGRTPSSDPNEVFGELIRDKVR